MFKRIFYAVFSVMLAVLISSTLFAENMYRVDYNKETGRISLNVTDVSLKKVLTDVASKSGVAVVFDLEAEKHVTLELKDVELDKGIKQLIKPNNHSMLYEETINSDGSKKIRLKKVLVFRENVGYADVLLEKKEDNASKGPVITGNPIEKGYDGTQIPPEVRINLSDEERKALKEEKKALRKERAMERRERARERRLNSEF